MYIRTRMGLTAELLDSLEAVEPTVAEWDALAVAAQRPFCAPAWLLAWWRHAAPGDPLLRIVVVRDGDRIVGVAPLFAARWRGLWTYSLLGTHTTWRIEPLAAAGREDDVAAAFADALAAAEPFPDLIHLEGVPADSPWPDLLARHWPGKRAFRHDRPVTPAPTLALAADDLDGWLKGKSSNFRQQMRRMRRKLEKEGAVFRMAQTPEEIDRDLAEFERLHRARWDWRGGSMSLTPGSDGMLREAGRALVGEGRFRLVSIELDGKVINSQLHVAAGGEVSYWNGGFDADYSAFKPSFVGLLHAIGDALERDDVRFDLGPGAQDYKYRLADGEDLLERVTLIPPGPRHALARAAWAPIQLRYAITERMTPEQKLKLRELLQRARGRLRR
jgi:CelD/BcsL family acetyltransferase involved in cellulose biosynthesis